MNASPKPTEKQHRLLFGLITLVIWCLATGISFLTPEKYHSRYALLLAVIFLFDVLLLLPLKKQKISEDEKRSYPLFLLMGVVLILWASILLYTGGQPGIWILSFVVGAGLLTSMIVVQFLRNHKIIP